MIEKIRSSTTARYTISAITGFIIMVFSLLNLNFESSGLFSFFIVIMIIAYIAIHKLFLDRLYPRLTARVKKYTICLFSFLLGLIFLSATLESILTNINTSLGLVLVTVFIFIHTYIQFIRIRTNKNWVLILQEFGWIKIVFSVGISLFLVAASYDDDSLVDITGMIWLLSLILMIATWLFKQIKFILNLKKEKKQTELLHLKNQVNPHFFFNMLNNLYALVDEDTEKAKKLILSLSDLMRYSIYEGEKDLVSLKEEVSYIQNYLELHKMRYHKEIDIQFSNDIEDMDIQIMPLIYIILVVNAFKHGVEKLRKGAFVHLSLKEENKNLVFSIKNNFDPEEVSDQEGIGLNNLKRRLELVYPKRHQLTSEHSGDIYTAQLTLQRI